MVGRLPYRVESERRRKDELTAPSAEEERRCGRLLLRVLLKAASPVPAQRYPNAAGFLEAMEQAALGRDDTQVEGDHEEINPFVDELRRPIAIAPSETLITGGLKARSVGKRTLKPSSTPNCSPRYWKANIAW